MCTLSPTRRLPRRRTRPPESVPLRFRPVDRTEDTRNRRPMAARSGVIARSRRPTCRRGGGRRHNRRRPPPRTVNLINNNNNITSILTRSHLTRTLTPTRLITLRMDPSRCPPINTGATTRPSTPTTLTAPRLDMNTPQRLRRRHTTLILSHTMRKASTPPIPLLQTGRTRAPCLRSRGRRRRLDRRCRLAQSRSTTPTLDRAEAHSRPRRRRCARRSRPSRWRRATRTPAPSPPRLAHRCQTRACLPRRVHRRRHALPHLRLRPSTTTNPDPSWPPSRARPRSTTGLRGPRAMYCARQTRGSSIGRTRSSS